MRNINKVILLGNLTRDPEMKKTLSNQAITTFGVATNRDWTTKDGNREHASEFHELVCFARLAEFAAENLKKGKLVYVEGHLKTRSWDDASGVKKFRTEIVVEDLIMLDRRPKDHETPDGWAPQSGTAPSSEAPIKQSAFPGSDRNQSYNKTQSSVSIEDPLTI